MTLIKDVKPGAQDILRQVNTDMYADAYKKGRSLSAHLDALMPQKDYNDGLDGFSRLLRASNILTRSAPEMGIWANQLSDFESDPNVRMLIPELFARMFRRVSLGGSRAFYSSTDEIPGTSMRPFAAAMEPRVQPRRQPPVRLADLVAVTTPVDSDVYKSYYLTDDVSAQRMVRVAESADIPMAKLVGGDHSINLLKYGRGLLSSYEALRRMRVDKVQFWIERLAVQTEIDKVAHAIYTLVNGDGNSNTSATNWRAKTDLDAAATGKTITLKAWLAFKLKFQPSYRLTHILASEGDTLKLLLTPIGSSSTAIPVVLQAPGAVGSLSAMGSQFAGDVMYGVTSDVPADKLVGLDATAALEMVYEVGANIEEVQRWARNQTEALFMTETLGFAVLDANATKTLELET